MASTNTTAFVVTAVVAALLGAAYSSGIVTVAAVIVKVAGAILEIAILAAVFLLQEASQAHSQAHNGHNRQGAAVLSAGPSQSGPSTGVKYISQTRAFSHENGYLNQDNLEQTAELSPSGVRLTKVRLKAFLQLDMSFRMAQAE
jgi:hypothetical protein